MTTQMLISPMTGGVLTRHSDLKSEKVRAYSKHYPPHLYLICTRPQITIDKEIMRCERVFVLRFFIHSEKGKETHQMPIFMPDVAHIETKYPYNVLWVFNKDGTCESWCTAIFYQKYAAGLWPSDMLPGMHDIEYAKLNDYEKSTLKDIDLEVQYVGKAYGKDGSRIAPDRLKAHEQLPIIYDKTQRNAPHLDVWLVLLSFEPQINHNHLGPESEGDEISVFIKRAGNPSFIEDDYIRTCFTEAALINYFQPMLNGPSYKKNFPSKRHKTYQKLYDTPIDLFAFLLDSNAYGGRLSSQHVEPKYTHYQDYKFNSAAERHLFLSLS